MTSKRSSADVSALILAGGKATRLGGIAKHLIVVDGETIFARQVRLLAPRVHEILVSAPQPVAGYRTVADTVNDAGPLAGIAAGLAACTTDWLLVVAGDMPHVTEDLVDTLLAHRSHDGVGVRSGGLPEPLVCVLHRRVRPIVEDRLRAGQRKASGLLADARLRVHWVDWHDAAALRNVNRPDDLG